jgi:hypothetical protein
MTKKQTPVKKAATEKAGGKTAASSAVSKAKASAAPAKKAEVPVKKVAAPAKKEVAPAKKAPAKKAAAANDMGSTVNIANEKPVTGVKTAAPSAVKKTSATAKKAVTEKNSTASKASENAPKPAKTAKLSGVSKESKAAANDSVALESAASAPAIANLAMTMPTLDVSVEHVFELPTLESVPADDKENPDIRIFQIHYQPHQLGHLDPAFAPYDNAGDKSPLLEFNVFTKLANSPQVAGAHLWGAVSWKFGQKTGTAGADYVREIRNHPGYDAYFCNAYPYTEAIYHNLWVQGETAHPDFIALCQEIFQAAGLPLEFLTEVQPTREFATANYFVATPAFWSRYIAFVKKILAAADAKISPNARRILYSSAADQKGLHANATYVPFIVERLFSVFLKTEGSNFKAYKIPLANRDEGANVHLKLLGEMKDVAYKTKSLWMAACWVNYRNLYLANMYGPEWTQKYLRKITPGKIVFSNGIDNITSGTAQK